VPPGVEPVDYTVAPRDLVSVVSVPDGFLVRLGRGGNVDARERERLKAYVADVAANRPESVHVLLHGPAAPSQFRAVARVLIADGIDPANIVRAAPGTGAPSPRGAVAMGIERAVAVLPDCPGWVDHVSAPEDNRTSPNFGCSDVSNFAAMVGDPHHLAAGASSIYHDGERGAIAVATYRADKVYDKWIKELPKSETFSIMGR
jgi:pilus biogenesis lipoprotein CpaD